MNAHSTASAGLPGGARDTRHARGRPRTHGRQSHRRCAAPAGRAEVWLWWWPWNYGGGGKGMAAAAAARAAVMAEGRCRRWRQLRWRLWRLRRWCAAAWSAVGGGAEVGPPSSHVAVTAAAVPAAPRRAAAGRLRWWIRRPLRAASGGRPHPTAMDTEQQRRRVTRAVWNQESEPSRLSKPNTLCFSFFVWSQLPPGCAVPIQDFLTTQITTHISLDLEAVHTAGFACATESLSWHTGVR